MNRPINFRRRALGALLLCMLGVSFLAQAQTGSSFTAQEKASLPEYCQDKLNSSRNSQKWESYFGKDIWLHMHHYCYGMVYFSRASVEIDAQLRRRSAQQGIGDFNYVLERWPANSQFYQQAQIYKTQLEMMKNWK